MANLIDEATAWALRLEAAHCDSAHLAMQKCEVKDKAALTELVDGYIRTTLHNAHRQQDLYQAMGDAFTMAILVGAHLEREGVL